MEYVRLHSEIKRYMITYEALRRFPTNYGLQHEATTLRLLVENIHSNLRALYEGEWSILSGPDRDEANECFWVDFQRRV